MKIKASNIHTPSITRKTPYHYLMNRYKSDNFSCDSMDILVEIEEDTYFAQEVGINTKQDHFTANERIDYAHNCEELHLADDGLDIMEILEEVSEGDF